MWRSAIRDLAIVLGVSWLARIVFVMAIGDAHSMDVEHWQGVLAAQDARQNPYETGVLNWPPFWLQVIVAIDYTAGVLGLSFLTALRVYLVLVESVLIVVLYLILVSQGVGRGAVRRALLVGIALNPVAVILVCQHGNSDVQVGLLVTLAVAALLAHERTRDVVFWLCGCLLLGLGVLAKTAPLVLAPVLAPGARLASRTGRALGAALFLGPAALGVSVLLALNPTTTFDHVIGYRSTRGFFGLSGILHETFDRLASIDVQDRYNTLFTVAVLALVAWLGYRLWREPPPAAARLFLLVAVVFLAVVAFGPGYGPQYAYWFLPALVATYVLLDDAWRRLLIAAYVIAGVTYAIEYAFVSFLGAYAVAIIGADDWILDIAAELESPGQLVVFRLPLFVVYLVVIAAGISRLTDSTTGEPAADDAKV
jgi:hypothetical protein